MNVAALHDTDFAGLARELFMFVLSVGAILGSRVREAGQLRSGGAAKLVRCA
jgi:hypothetical protein